MNVDRTTIKNSSLGEHHMVWNAKTKLYTDELKYKVQAIWNIYLLDAVLPKEFSTVAVQEKKITGENAYYAHSKFLRNYILLSVNFHFILFSFVKTRANGRNILDVTCYVCLHTLLHVVGCCCVAVALSLKPVKLFGQELPTFLLFRDRRNVAQQCWIRLHSSSNIVGATHAHYAWFTKTYGLYPSHDALQVPTLLVVVAYVCIPLPTRTQQLPTFLAQQCWELLRPFARSLTVEIYFGALMI